jgi:hypothetical protein
VYKVFQVIGYSNILTKEYTTSLEKKAAKKQPARGCSGVHVPF